MTHTIIVRSARCRSGWEEIYGHACQSIREMQEYCKLLDPKYGTEDHLLKIVPLPFDNGGFISET